jgi:hypothetical protein
MGPKEFIPGYQQVNAARGIGHALLRPIVVLGLVAGGAVGATSAIGQHMEYASLTASADLNKAHTSSDAKMLKFNEDQKIDVATAYFSEKFTATKIPYQIDWHPTVLGITSPLDVIPDFDVNKELNGVGVEKFLVPFTALKPSLDPKTGKTDIEVDGSKVSVSSSWVESPVIRDFVPNGITRSYEADNVKANLVKNISANFTHFSIDNFTNAIKDLDMLTGRAMSSKALETFTQQCPKQLDGVLKTAINKALVANFKSTGQDASKLGEVTYTPAGFTWTEEQLPAAVQAAVDKTYAHNKRITVDKNFTVDEMKCNVSGPKGAQ